MRLNNMTRECFDCQTEIKKRWVEIILIKPFWESENSECSSRMSRKLIRRVCLKCFEAKHKSIKLEEAY